MSGPLTSRDPEPGLGAKVQDDLGRIWVNTGGERVGASNWELDDTGNTGESRSSSIAELAKQLGQATACYIGGDDLTSDLFDPLAEAVRARYAADEGDPIAVRLDCLTYLRGLAAALQATIDCEASKTRREGASWERLGKALGVSKQAAQQRYGGMSDEPPVTLYTCVYGKCNGAHVEALSAADGDRWMDEHVRNFGHSRRWPVTFRVEYPGSQLPAAAYRDPVRLDD